MYYLGGYRPFKLRDTEGNIIWEEFSQAPDTQIIYFLIPGTESDENVRPIAKRMDYETKNSSEIYIVVNGIRFKITITFHLTADGKLIEIWCSLLGAVCTACLCTRDDIHDPDCALAGFPITRTIVTINTRYKQLIEKDGRLIRRSGTYIKNLDFINYY